MFNNINKIMRKQIFLIQFLTFLTFLAFFLLLPERALATSSVWTAQGPYGLTSYDNQTLYPFPRFSNEILAISPTSSSTAYIGTKGGGIFKTIDGGENWQSINSGISGCVGGWLGYSEYGENSVTALAIDPNNSDNIWTAIYCSPAPATGLGVGQLIRIYKSTNAGTSWSLVRQEENNNSGVIFYPILMIRIAPSDSNTIYVYHDRIRTDYTSDGGTTWMTTSSTGLILGADTHAIKELIVSASTPTTLFALLNYSTNGNNTTSNSGIFKSTDSGNNWTAINGNLVNTDLLYPRALKRIGENDGSFYYASGVKLYKTIDGGAAWSVVITSTAFTSTLLVDPVATTTLYSVCYNSITEYLSDAGFRKSINSGASWSIITPWSEAPDVGYGPNFPVVQSKSDPNVLFWVGRDTVYKSSDGGLSWQRKDVGLKNISIRSLTVDPTAPSILYAGAKSPSHLYRSSNSGASWSLIETGINSSDIYKNIKKIIVNPLATSTIYVLFEYGVNGKIYKSTDSGSNWSALALPFYPYDILYSSSFGGLVAVGSDGANNHIYKSIDGGSSWPLVSNVSNLATNIAVRPGVTTTMYAWGDFNSSFFKTIDSGASWSDIYLPQITDIAINQVNPNIMYASLNNDGIYKSTNAGSTWARLNNGWPVGTPALGSGLYSSVTIDPLNENAVYATSLGQGVYTSTNAGSSWFFLNGTSTTALSNFYINKLVNNPENSSILWVGTNGGGIWEDPIDYSSNPIITSLSSNTILVGQSLTIYGNGFGSVQGDSTLLIGGEPTAVDFWSDTEISLTFATTMVTGATNAVVNNAEIRQGSLPYDFTIISSNTTTAPKANGSNKGYRRNAQRATRAQQQKAWLMKLMR